MIQTVRSGSSAPTTPSSGDVSPRTIRQASRFSISSSRSDFSDHMRTRCFRSALAPARPSALKAYGIRADVVEIDPEVVRMAKEYFGFSTQGTIHVEDARTYLRRT